MKTKNLKAAKLILKLTNYLILTLDELNKVEDATEFTEGEITAYVECLEVLSEWKNFKNLNIGKIEEKYPVN